MCSHSLHLVVERFVALVLVEVDLESEYSLGGILPFSITLHVENFPPVHELIVLFSQRDNVCQFAVMRGEVNISHCSYFIGAMNTPRTIDRDCFRCSLQTMITLKMNRPLLHGLRRAQNAYFVLLSLFSLVNAPLLFHICSLYRGFC